MTTEGDGLSHLLFLVLGAIELNRIVLAFRAFFNLMFSGETFGRDPDRAQPLAALRRRAGESRRARARRAGGASDGALQFWAFCRRLPLDRFPDGGRVRLHRRTDRSRREGTSRSMPRCHRRYVTLAPVIDGVEGTYAKAPGRIRPGEVRGQRAGQTSGRRNAPAQGMARHQGGPAAAGGEAGRQDYRRRGN